MARRPAPPLNYSQSAREQPQRKRKTTPQDDRETNRTENDVRRRCRHCGRRPSLPSSPSPSAPHAPPPANALITDHMISGTERSFITVSCSRRCWINSLHVAEWVEN